MRTSASARPAGSDASPVSFAKRAAALNGDWTALVKSLAKAVDGVRAEIADNTQTVDALCGQQKRMMQLLVALAQHVGMTVEGFE